VSRDDGCTVRWICEADLGYGGRWDPAYAIAGDGTIFATTYTGLRVSHDDGCSFATATAALPAGDPGRTVGRWVDALELGPDGTLWVGTSDTSAPNDVFASTDGGATFASRGLSSPTMFWKSVKAAPSDTRRVYVTGYERAGASADGGILPPPPQALRTDDAGAHWAELSLAGLTYGPIPIVLALAVDPHDPDVVYLISRGANPPTGDRLCLWCPGLPSLRRRAGCESTAPRTRLLRRRRRTRLSRRHLHRCAVARSPPPSGFQPRPLPRSRPYFATGEISSRRDP
jgi:hypothetical protein